MKKRFLISVFAIVLAVMTLLAGCKQDSETNSSSKTGSHAIFQNNQSSISSTNTDDPKVDSMLFGVIKNPIIGFDSIVPMPETVPSVYEENGLFGYKNADGSVLIAAEYNVAQEFYQGYGAVRKDTIVNGENHYEWFKVSSTGKLFAADWLNYDETIGLWFGAKDAKYGVIDGDANEIIPFEFDILTKENGESLCTTVKAEQIIYFDLAEGCSYRYEPYQEESKESYSNVLNLTDYDLFIVGNQLLVNGEWDSTGHLIPLSLIQDIDWDVYIGAEKVGTSKVKIIPGDYGGTINFVFTDLFDRNIIPNKYFAVPNYVAPFPTEIKSMDGDIEHESYKPTIDQYLKDKGIENTSYEIDNVFIGNILNNDTLSAVICVFSSGEFINERWDESWDEMQYKENKAAVFSSILIIPDCNKPLEYLVEQENIYQTESAVMAPRTYLCGVADVLKPKGYDLVLIYGLYEGIDVAVCPITNIS